jgi:hypothetical protein
MMLCARGAVLLFRVFLLMRRGGGFAVIGLALIMCTGVVSLSASCSVSGIVSCYARGGATRHCGWKGCIMCKCRSVCYECV